ncbi:unnamed protein product [Leptosia nina]|uniref:Uncharacterized protein n=1 Tax=Leptosia nina TaxID=320188 RepID=A0AAV1JBU7_9NEOP
MCLFNVRKRRTNDIGIAFEKQLIINSRFDFQISPTSVYNSALTKQRLRKLSSRVLTKSNILFSTPRRQHVGARESLQAIWAFFPQTDVVALARACSCCNGFIIPIGISEAYGKKDITRPDRDERDL